MYIDFNYQRQSVTKTLVTINVIIFFFTLLNQNFMTRTFALFYPTSHYFHWWQYVTHMFMHGGIWHIAFNMIALYSFGNVLEQSIGAKKFLILYFVSGFGAVALHFGVQALEVAALTNQIAEGSQSALQAYMRIKVTPTVGASGAIYGLLMAYAMLYPNARFSLIFPPISFNAATGVIIFAVIELFTGISGWMDGVAHFAHLGGMVFGYLLIRYWRRKGILFSDYRGF